MSARPRQHSISSKEAGSVSAFVVLLATCLAALLGLVAEGGQVMEMRAAAMTEVEQAARTGAAQLSPTTVHAGDILDGGDAPAAAAILVMSGDGHPGSAIVKGTTVTAAIRPFSVATPLLSLVGVPSIEITATASATALAG
jgi:hypothetical protein